MSRPSAIRNSLEADALRLSELLAALGRLNSLRDPLTASLEAKGLTASQVHALMWIGRDRLLSMGELAQRLGVTEKTITGVVDRLERDDFVRRVREDADRRVVQVELTDAGQVTFRELDTSVRHRLGDFLGLLGEPDREALFGMLDRLLLKLHELRSAPSTPVPDVD